MMLFDESNFSTIEQDKEFTKALLGAMSPPDVGWVAFYIGNNFQPEQVFSPKKLDAWALDNGYTKER